MLLVNEADGAHLQYTRRLVATLRSVLPDALLRADASVLKGRRFGNVVLAASRAPLPVEPITRAAAGAMFPQRVVHGGELADLVGGAVILTDTHGLRSPQPPDELWRVGG